MRPWCSVAHEIVFKYFFFRSFFSCEQVLVLGEVLVDDDVDDDDDVGVCSGVSSLLLGVGSLDFWVWRKERSFVVVSGGELQ